MDLSSLPGPASYAVAAAARSILACPATADLEVDRLPLAIDDAVLGEAGGRPTLTCEVGSPLARAAAARSVARLRVGSAVLAGRLGPLETTTCGSCADEHLVVTLDPAAALVTLAGHRHQLPLGDYLSPAHQLNRGHLQRSLEHLEEHHHLDLRRSVAASTGTPLDDVVAVRLRDLDARGVGLEWVDPGGAHQVRLRFPRRAASTAELGRLLREGIAAPLG
jgi:hypothetical protein